MYEHYTYVIFVFFLGKTARPLPRQLLLQTQTLLIKQTSSKWLSTIIGADAFCWLRVGAANRVPYRASAAGEIIKISKRPPTRSNA